MDVKLSRNMWIALVMAVVFAVYALDVAGAVPLKTISGSRLGRWNFCYTKTNTYRFSFKMSSKVCVRKLILPSFIQVGRVVPDKQTMLRIQRLYSGLFRPASAMRHKRDVPSKSRRKLSSHDNDVLCPTIREIERLPMWMKDTKNKRWEIVHFTKYDLYQFAEIGRCAPTNQQRCHPNHGECFLNKVLVYILVWKDPFPTDGRESPLSFEPFEIGGYCSCKNVGFS